MLLYSHLYVFGLSAPRAPSNLLSSRSLAKRAAWCVSVSLGVAVIWQRPGLHPKQETHPSDAAGCQFVCTLLHVCVCVCTVCRPALFLQTGGVLSPMSSPSFTSLFFLLSSDTVCCRRPPLMFPHGFCFLISLTLHLSPLCHSYWFLLLFLQVLLECPFTVPQNCFSNALSEICPRETAASVHSKKKMLGLG